MKYNDYEPYIEDFAVFPTAKGCVIAREKGIVIVDGGTAYIRESGGYDGVCGNRNDACRIAQQIRKGKFDFRQLEGMEVK